MNTLWLYEPAQQRILMSFGVPPIVQDPELERAFQTSASPTVADIFAPGQLQDIGALAKGLAGAMADPANIPSYLKHVQDSLEAQIAETLATCAKTPTPPHC